MHACAQPIRQSACRSALSPQLRQPGHGVTTLAVVVDEHNCVSTVVFGSAHAIVTVHHCISSPSTTSSRALSYCSYCLRHHLPTTITAGVAQPVGNSFQFVLPRRSKGRQAAALLSYTSLRSLAAYGQMQPPTPSIRVHTRHGRGLAGIDESPSPSQAPHRTASLARI